MNFSKNLSALFLLFSLVVLSCQSNAQKGIDLNPIEFKAGIDKESNAVILDVRTPEEVAQGIIPGAKVINFHDANFKEQIGELDKTKTYYVYCKGGGRSGKTCSALQGAGFPKTYNLKGGITAWKKQGLPTSQQ
ncbi:MAG: rhodanese-like domain-containing protein [Saprospiraceae bacterium]